MKAMDELYMLQKKAIDPENTDFFASHRCMRGCILFKIFESLPHIFSPFSSYRGIKLQFPINSLNLCRRKIIMINFRK